MGDLRDNLFEISKISTFYFHFDFLLTLTLLLELRYTQTQVNISSTFAVKLMWLSVRLSVSLSLRLRRRVVLWRLIMLSQWYGAWRGTCRKPKLQLLRANLDPCLEKRWVKDTQEYVYVHAFVGFHYQSLDTPASNTCPACMQTPSVLLKKNMPWFTSCSWENVRSEHSWKLDQAGFSHYIISLLPLMFWWLYYCSKCGK